MYGSILMLAEIFKRL